MNNSNRKHNIRIILLVVGSFIFVNAIFFLFSDVFDILNVRINDQFFKLRYRIKGPEPVWNGGQGGKKSFITMVELDERGHDKLEGLKEDTVNQTFEADIINILSDSNVSGIAYDTVFATEATRDLIDATSRANTLYYPVILAPANPAVQSKLDEDNVLKKNLWYLKETRRGTLIDSGIYAAPKPELAREAKGIGHINISPDIDGVYRRVPLLIKHEGGYFPSLTLRMAADYLGVTPAQIEVAFGKHILLTGAKFPDGSKRDIKIPIDDRGDMIINFAGKWLDVFDHISFIDMLQVLDDEDLIKVLNNRIGDNLVIVADVSSRGKDFGAVPLENFYPLSSIHANVLNSILTLNFIDEFKPWQRLLIDLLLVLIICVAAIKTRALVFSGLTILIFALFIAFVLWLFLYNNTLTNVLSPSLGIVFSFIFVNLYRYIREEQEKAFLFHTFESYFAPSVMNKILKNPERLESSERKFLTILFSDISGFTSWCSTREPEEIHRTLNEYFSEMARIIFKHEGTIDKYMGDGMLAFFGDPIEYDDHALRTVKAAIEMQQKARKLKKQWEAQGRLQIQMRIGINTGEVVVGNMGSKSRMDYTVLGSNVNLAQRLEANAPSEGILISQAVHNELKKEEEKDKNRVRDINTTSYGKINVKGISEEIDVYQVVVPEPEPESK
ncbi:MAG: CHASE2 domain-containing protein [Thermodesulfobacteriota bacterium]